MTTALQVETALDAYHRIRQFEIDDRRHGIVMAVADLLLYARTAGINDAAIVQEAQWLVDESEVR